MKSFFSLTIVLILAFLPLLARAEDITIQKTELVSTTKYDLQKKKLVWEATDFIPMRTFGPIIHIDKPVRGIKFFRKGRFKLKIKGHIQDCIPELADYKDGRIEKVIINNETIELDSRGYFRKTVELKEGNNFITVSAENILGHKFYAIVSAGIEPLGNHSSMFKCSVAVRPGYSQDPSIFFVYLRGVEGVEPDVNELKGELSMVRDLEQFKKKFSAVYKKNKVGKDEEKKKKGRWIEAVFQRKSGTSDFVGGPFLMSTVPLRRPEVVEGLSIEVPILVGRAGEKIYLKPRGNEKDILLGSLSFVQIILPPQISRMAAATGREPSYTATIIHSDDVKPESIRVFVPASAMRARKDLNLTRRFKKVKDNVMQARFTGDKASAFFRRSGRINFKQEGKKTVKLKDKYDVPGRFSERKVKEYFVVSEMIHENREFNDLREDIDTLMKSGDTTKAIKLCMKGYRQFKDQQEVFAYSLGVLFFQKKDYRNSMKYLNQVLKRYPTDPGSLLYKAWCFYSVNDTRNALKMAKRILTFAGKDDPNGNWLIACVCVKKKDYKNAKIYCRKTLRGAPNHAQAKNLMKQLSRHK